MLTLLSPAKNLNFDPAPEGLEITRPVLSSDTKELAAVTRKLTRGDLKQLMGISDNLADLNYERFQAFKTRTPSKGVVQAALGFNGDVYLGLDARRLTEDDLTFAQGQLRILSGLYGLLKPLDAIQPYRLEMGTRLKTDRGSNLYQFWQERITRELNRELKSHDDPTLVCLASNEYFKSVDRKALKHSSIMMSFKEEKDGKSRSLMLYAKQARGMMARWAITNRVDRAEGLKDFKVAGYSFRPKESDDATWVFARKQPPPKNG